MKLTSYLVLNGNAEEAANFYANVLNGKIENIFRYDSRPDQLGLPEIPDNFKQKVLHCGIDFPGGTLSVADALPNDERNFGKGGYILTLMCDSIAQTEDVYAKLIEGAQKIECELGEVFFAKLYGEVIDRYGVHWAIMFEEN